MIFYKMATMRVRSYAVIPGFPTSAISTKYNELIEVIPMLFDKNVLNILQKNVHFHFLKKNRYRTFSL